MSQFLDIINHMGTPGFFARLGLAERPEQQILLRRMAEHVEIGGWPHSRNAPLGLQEAGAGIGKTIVELVIAKTLAYCSPPGRRLRTVISTYSRGLRAQIVREAPIAAKILAAACREMGMSPPGSIPVNEMFSFTQFVSPHKINLYDKQVQKDRTLNPIEVEQWHKLRDAFVLASAELEDGQPHPVTFEELIEDIDGQPLPFSLTQLDLALTENPADEQIRSILLTRRDQAIDADVLVVTHMMLNLLTTRLLFLDAEERDGRKIMRDTAPIYLAVGDECHKIPEIARNQIEFRLGLKSMRDVVQECSSFLSSEARNAFEGLEQWLLEKVGEERAYHVNTADRVDSFVEVIKLFRDSARDVLHDEWLWDNYPIRMSRLETLLSRLTEFHDIFERAGTADQAVYAISDAYPLVERGIGDDVILRLSVANISHRISFLWRRSDRSIAKRLYKSVIFLSGTIADGTPSAHDPYTTFRREIGALSLGGPRQDVRNLGPPIPARHMGHASRLVMIERNSKRLPTLPAPSPSGTYTNPAHNEDIAETVVFTFNKKKATNRVLALFRAEQTMLDVLNYLKKHHREVAKHVTVQRNGMTFDAAPLKAFRADPHAILFSHAWEGINPVDKDGKSIVDHLIITKLPLTPFDERRMSEYPTSTIRWEFTKAIWLLRQALARPMRDETANFCCWILDGRMPLPIEMDPALTGIPRTVSAKFESASHYAEFEQAISLRLFGMRPSLLRRQPSDIGYLTREDGKFELQLHKVVLAPRWEDLVDASDLDKMIA